MPFKGASSQITNNEVGGQDQLQSTIDPGLLVMDISTPTEAHSVYYSATSSLYHTPRSSLDSSNAGTTPHGSQQTTLHTSADYHDQTNKPVHVETSPSTSRLDSSVIFSEHIRGSSGYFSRASISPAVDAPLATRFRKRERSPAIASSIPSVSVKASLPTTITSTGAPASRSSSAKSSHLHTPARPCSPLILANMLRDVSPRSPSYDVSVRHAVEQAVASLMRRGREREGHGVRELYLQSFKDAGTADLLDALLQLRTSERQRWDFDRFVEDMNRVENASPPGFVDTACENDSNGDERKENLEHESGIAGVCESYKHNPTASCASGDHISAAGRSQDQLDKPSIAVYHSPSLKVLIDSPSTGTRPDSMPRSDDAEGQTPQARLPRSRYGLRDKLDQNAHGEVHDDVHRPFSFPERYRPLLLHPVKNVQEHVKGDECTLHDRVALDADHIVSNSWQPPSFQRPSKAVRIGHRARGKKRKNRMFSGANGPVFFKSLFKPAPIKHGAAQNWSRNLNRFHL